MNCGDALSPDSEKVRNKTLHMCMEGRAFLKFALAVELVEIQEGQEWKKNLHVTNQGMAYSPR